VCCIREEQEVEFQQPEFARQVQKETAKQSQGEIRTQEEDEKLFVTRER
jgi:hypothetical protein